MCVDLLEFSYVSNGLHETQPNGNCAALNAIKQNKKSNVTRGTVKNDR